MPEPHVLKKPENNTQQHHVLTSVHHESIFLGPLPPPEALAQYERVLPGAADRIMTMAEKQADHRQKLERRVVGSNTFNERLGMILAFIVVISLMGFGGFLIYSNKSIPAGYLSVFAPLFYVGVSFFY